VFSGNTDAIEITELNIPNASHENESGELQSIIFNVEVTYTYESNKPLDRVVVSLDAKHDTWQPIARRETTADVPQSASKTVTLTGDLFDTGWAATDFSVPNEGNRTQQSMPVRALMQARKNGNIVKEQVAETNVTLVLIHKEKLTITGEIGGTGEVQFTDA